MSLLLAVALVVPARAADAPTVSAAPGKGVTVTTADEKFSLNLKGRFQVRETLTAKAPDDERAREVTAITQVYTARLWLSGYVLAPTTKYMLQLAVAPADFRDGATSPVYDAYLDFARNENASVRVGQIFVPFDRARTNREFALQMATRPRPVSELTLDRVVGAYLYSNHLGGDDSPFAYRLGVFGGGGPNALVAKEPGGLAVARVELAPFGYFDDVDSEGDLGRREAPALSIGLAGAYNLNTDRARSTTGTTFVGGTTDYLHAAADLVLKLRGFALMAEGVVRDASADVIRSEDEDGAPVVEATRSGWGALVQPSYLLTEHLELSARYSRTAALDGTDPAFVEELLARRDEVAGGLSVYLNGHRFKVQTTWVALCGEAGLGDAEHSAYLLLDATF